MQKNIYEIMVIIKPNVDINESINNFQKFLLDNKYTRIIKTLDLKEKILSYKIKKFTTAYYIVFYVETLPSFILKIKNFLLLKQDYLRNLIINLHKEKGYFKYQKKINKSIL